MQYRKKNLYNWYNLFISIADKSINLSQIIYYPKREKKYLDLQSIFNFHLAPTTKNKK